MADIVDARAIERIVGTLRHATEHIGRAVSTEQTVYVMHSHQCLAQMAARTSDIRSCPFAIAQDKGIDPDIWRGYEDIPVTLAIEEDFGDLIPLARMDGTS